MGKSKQKTVDFNQLPPLQKAQGDIKFKFMGNSAAQPPLPKSDSMNKVNNDNMPSTKLFIAWGVALALSLAILLGAIFALGSTHYLYLPAMVVSIITLGSSIVGIIVALYNRKKEKAAPKDGNSLAPTGIIGTMVLVLGTLLFLSFYATYSATYTPADALAMAFMDALYVSIIIFIIGIVIVGFWGLFVLYEEEREEVIQKQVRDAIKSPKWLIIAFLAGVLGIIIPLAMLYSELLTATVLSLVPLLVIIGSFAGGIFAIVARARGRHGRVSIVIVAGIMGVAILFYILFMASIMPPPDLFTTLFAAYGILVFSNMYLFLVLAVWLLIAAFYFAIPVPGGF